MRAAAVREPDRLEIVEVRDPAPGPYQALVRILACGICGTDLHIFRGRFPLRHYPCLLGHESIGRVLEIGAKVDSFRPGDLVLRPTPAPPGQKLDGYASLWSGFSEYGLVFDEAAFKADCPSSRWGEIPGWADAQKVVPSDFDPEAAGIFITFKETLSFLERVGLQPGMQVMVTGTGPAGLCFVRAAKLLGAGPVIVYGRRASTLEVARVLGADLIVGPNEADLAEGLRRSAGQVDLVIEATGDTRVLENATGVLARGGRVGLYAVYTETHFLMPLALGERAFLRVSPREGDTHTRALDALRLGFFEPAVFETRTFDLADTAAALEVVERRGVLKASIQLGV